MRSNVRRWETCGKSSPPPERNRSNPVGPQRCHHKTAGIQLRKRKTNGIDAGELLRFCVVRELLRQSPNLRLGGPNRSPFRIAFECFSCVVILFAHFSSLTTRIEKVNNYGKKEANLPAAIVVAHVHQEEWRKTNGAPLYAGLFH